MIDRSAIEAAVGAYVDAGTLVGAATLAWRDGRVVHAASVGRRDLRTNLPVERDTIFRIASMTKPVTTVAALMLLDEGRFALDEPIAVLAPELAGVRVLRDPNRLPDIFPLAPEWRIVLFGLGALQFARHPEGLVEAGKARWIGRIERRLPPQSPPSPGPSEPVDALAEVPA